MGEAVEVGKALAELCHIHVYVLVRIPIMAFWGGYLLLGDDPMDGKAFWDVPVLVPSAIAKVGQDVDSDVDYVLNGHFEETFPASPFHKDSGA